MKILVASAINCEERGPDAFLFNAAYKGFDEFVYAMQETFEAEYAHDVELAKDDAERETLDTQQQELLTSLQKWAEENRAEYDKGGQITYSPYDDPMEVYFLEWVEVPV